MLGGSSFVEWYHGGRLVRTMRLTAALKREAKVTTLRAGPDGDTGQGGEEHSEGVVMNTWRDMVVTQDDIDALKAEIMYEKEASDLAKQFAMLSVTRPEMVPHLIMLHSNVSQIDAAESMDTIRSAAKDGVITIRDTPLATRLPTMQAPAEPYREQLKSLKQALICKSGVEARNQSPAATA